MLSVGGEPGPIEGVVTVVPHVETDPRWDVTRSQPVEESEDFADLVLLERFERDANELHPSLC